MSNHIKQRALKLSLLLIWGCSHAQKIMQTLDDAKKLETNKAQFVGKPLNALLNHIDPPIKYVYGNPENKWAGAIGGT